MAALLPAAKADAEAVKAACLAVVAVLVATKPVVVWRATAVWPVVKTASSLAALQSAAQLIALPEVLLAVMAVPE